MNEKEVLSQASFWTVVTGSILIGLEGLGMLAGKQLNPLQIFSGKLAETFTTAIYSLIGVAGLHQAYFGYSSFKQDLEKVL